MSIIQDTLITTADYADSTVSILSLLRLTSTMLMLPAWRNVLPEPGRPTTLRSITASTDASLSVLLASRIITASGACQFVLQILKVMEISTREYAFTPADSVSSATTPPISAWCSVQASAALQLSITMGITSLAAACFGALRALTLRAAVGSALTLVTLASLQTTSQEDALLTARHHKQPLRILPLIAACASVRQAGGQKTQRKLVCPTAGPTPTPASIPSAPKATPTI